MDFDDPKPLKQKKLAVHCERCDAKAVLDDFVVPSNDDDQDKQVLPAKYIDVDVFHEQVFPRLRSKGWGMKLKGHMCVVLCKKCKPSWDNWPDFQWTGLRYEMVPPQEK